MPSREEKVIKELLRPARLAAGRFAIDEHLEQIVQQMHVRLSNLELEQLLLYQAARFVVADKIGGDYLEFGVSSGLSFRQAYRAFERAYEWGTRAHIGNTEQDRIDRGQLWKSMRFFAFDSFQGLPQPKGIDSISKDFTQGKFASSREQFDSTLVQSGVDMSRVQVVPGWFNETLTADTKKKLNLTRAAIVNIDSDLYESAAAALEFVSDVLVDGSILIFDDWFSYLGRPDLGEQRACQEWIAVHPELSLIEYLKEGPWTNSFIVHRREPT